VAGVFAVTEIFAVTASRAGLLPRSRAGGS